MRSFRPLLDASNRPTPREAKPTRVKGQPDPVAPFRMHTMDVRLVAVLLLEVATVFACQNSPFTSCVDDATPCEMTDVVDVNESTGAPTSAASTGGTAQATTTSTRNLNSGTEISTPGTKTSSAPNEDADVVTQPNEGDAGRLETNDASLETTAEPFSSESSAPDVEGADANATSEPATSSDETTTNEPVATGQSVIVNGDFSEGMTSWKLEQTSGRAQLTTDDDGALCVESFGNVEFTIGWPADASESAYLPSGAYQFSFRARGLQTEMEVKVGHAYEPYNALHEVDWSAEGDQWDEHLSTFMTGGDDAAGLAFFVRLTNGTLCIDDVSLSPILEAEPAE